MLERYISGRNGIRGATIGLVAGLIALAGSFAVASQCLPVRIASLPQPWPWYCADPAYSLMGYVAFPVNLLTNDLSQAVYLAPISLVIYVLVGALLELGLAGSKPATSDG